MLRVRTQKFNFLKLISCLLAVTVVMVFGTVDVNAKLRMKLAHQNNVYDADQLLVETIKKLVEEKTNGEIEFTIYPGTLTGSSEEAVEFLKAGTVDAGTVSAGHIAGFYKDIQFLQLPYLFKSMEHYKIARQSNPIKEVLEGVEKATGLKVLGIYSDCNGFAIASTKPIRSMDDTEGIKLRCMQNPLFIDIYEAFGFTVTPTDWGELYTSLQTGLVNANDLGVYCQSVFKLNEVVSYYAILNQMWTQKVFCMSQRAWDKLSDEQKDLMERVVKEAVELTDAWQYVRENEFIKKAEESDEYTVTYPDLAPFKKASQKVYDKWFQENPQWEKWYEEIQYLDPNERYPEAYKDL